jgi:guanylate kinase
MMDFPGRYILIKPPTPDALESRLKGAGGHDDTAIKAIIDRLPEQLDESKMLELFNHTIVNEDVEQSVKTLGEFLYKREDEVEEGEEEKAPNGELATNGGENMET